MTTDVALSSPDRSVLRTGIGSNAWQNANVVFLFDEFFVPRWVAAATTQGYRGHRVSEGDFGAMSTLRNKASGIDSIANGHTLRWNKQIAIRGNARNYDETGLCGKQRLVVGSDLKRFMTNATKLFPGAKIRTVGNLSDNATWITRILEILSNTRERVLTTKELTKITGKPWSKVSFNVLKPEFLSGIAALGWRYVSLKGCKGSRFERVAPVQPDAVLLPVMSGTRQAMGSVAAR